MEDNAETKGLGDDFTIVLTLLFLQLEFPRSVLLVDANRGFGLLVGITIGESHGRRSRGRR